MERKHATPTHHTNSIVSNLVCTQLERLNTLSSLADTLRTVAINSSLSRLTATTTSGLASMSVGIGGQALMQIVVLSVLARLLSPADFGLIGVASAIIGILMIFSQIGIGAALVQLTPLTPSHAAAALALSLLFASVMAGVLLSGADSIASFFQMPELRKILYALSMVFPMAALSTVSEAILQRMMCFRLLAAAMLLSYGLGYGLVGIVCANLGFGVWALVAAILAQNFLRTSCLLIAYPRGLALAKVNIKAATQLLRFGLGLSLGRVANQLATQGDNLIVGKLMASDAVGVYGRAYQLASLPANLLGSIIDKVLYPALAAVQSENVRLRRGFLRALRAAVATALPFSAVLVVLAPEVILFLLGPEWGEVVLPFQLLSVALVFRTSYKICDSLARAAGTVYRQAWRHWIYAVAVIVGSAVGQVWGLAGVAFGVAGAVALHYVLMLRLSVNLTGVTWSEIGIIHLSAAPLGLTVVGVTYGVAEWARGYGASPFLTLSAASLMLLLTFAILVRYFPRLLGSELSSLAASILRSLATIVLNKKGRSPPIRH